MQRYQWSDRLVGELLFREKQDAGVMFSCQPVELREPCNRYRVIATEIQQDQSKRTGAEQCFRRPSHVLRIDHAQYWQVAQVDPV